jgi:hypothetical protein
MTKTVTKAKAIFENILQNFSQWHTERAPSSSRKVNSVKQVDSLTAKVDAIYSYISKQNIDNVPLQDLVENNTKNTDINYIRNFGNNGYNNNYNNTYVKPPYVPNKYTSGSNVSNDLENTMITLYLLKKSLTKEFIAKSERFGALKKNVDHLTREIVTIKNHMQAQKHEETIKYVQDIIDRSWEALNMMDEEEEK